LSGKPVLPDIESINPPQAVTNSKGKPSQVRSIRPKVRNDQRRACRSARGGAMRSCKQKRLERYKSFREASKAPDRVHNPTVPSIRTFCPKVSGAEMPLFFKDLAVHERGGSTQSEAPPT